MGLTIQYLFFRFIAAIIRRLSLPTVRRVAGVVARIIHTFIPIRKAVALDNLRHAFPDMTERERDRIALLSMGNLMTMSFELLWTPRLTVEVARREMRIANIEVLQRAAEKKRGFIFLSAHFGNWEWLALGSGMVLDQPCTVIVQPLTNSKVSAAIEKYRSVSGNRLVPMGMAVREIISTLRSGGVLALLGDQSGPPNSLFVPFLGRPAATFEGPAAFALKTGAPLLLVLSMRAADGTYDIVFEEIPTDDIAEPTESNIAELTRRHVKALERRILERPGDWFWQHRRWKHAPKEGSRVVSVE
jgi:Kdo2-lipid IVA lauroyltransferase/acyltransferase